MRYDANYGNIIKYCFVISTLPNEFPSGRSHGRTFFLSRPNNFKSLITFFCQNVKTIQKLFSLNCYIYHLSFKLCKNSSLKAFSGIEKEFAPVSFVEATFVFQMCFQFTICRPQVCLSPDRARIPPPERKWSYFKWAWNRWTAKELNFDILVLCDTRRQAKEYKTKVSRTTLLVRSMARNKSVERGTWLLFANLRLRGLKRQDNYY